MMIVKGIDVSKLESLYISNVLSFLEITDFTFVDTNFEMKYT